MTKFGIAPKVTRTDSPTIIGKFKRLDTKLFISLLSHIRAGLQGKIGRVKNIGHL
jgi:hypothetical protein